MLSKENLGPVREAYYREYDTLRQESMQSMGNRTQIIAFGLGTIGVLIAATLTAPSRPPEFVWLMFNFALPAVSALVYLAWFAEFERMVRAGRYLQKLEDAINATLAHRVFSWEHDLENMRMGYAYLVVAALFLGLAVGAPFFALWLQEPALRPDSAQWLKPPSCGDAFLQTPWTAWVLTLVVTIFSGVRMATRFGRFSKSLPAPTPQGNAASAPPGAQNGSGLIG